LNERAALSPEMALRFEKAFGACMAPELIARWAHGDAAVLQDPPGLR
jgi:hypothetical protein